jgi:hypothetical protein
MSKKKVHILLIVCIGLVFLAVVVLVVYPILFGASVSGKLHHSFGVVPIERPATVLTHTFRLVNTTDHELQLTNAVPSCGCTTTDWPKEPFAVGEVIEVPVNLTLRRSQLRSSTVRLEFDTGEVVVLRIDGIGRFIQPLAIMPPTPILYPDAAQGTRAVLRLEWTSNQRPTTPTISIPKGLRIDFDTWTLSTEEDSNKGIPAIWTIRMRFTLDSAEVAQQEFTIMMEGAPDLVVPFTIAEAPLGAIRD